MPGKHIGLDQLLRSWQKHTPKAAEMLGTLCFSHLKDTQVSGVRVVQKDTVFVF